MGLLSQGSPLSWEETRRHAEHVRRHGILQFLHIYRALRDRHKDVLKWGDEVSNTRCHAELCPSLTAFCEEQDFQRVPSLSGQGAALRLLR